MGRCLELVAVDGDDLVSSEDLPALFRRTAREDLAHKESLALHAAGAGRARTTFLGFWIDI